MEEDKLICDIKDFCSPLLFYFVCVVVYFKYFVEFEVVEWLFLRVFAEYWQKSFGTCTLPCRRPCDISSSHRDIHMPIWMPMCLFGFREYCSESIVTVGRKT